MDKGNTIFLDQASGAIAGYVRGKQKGERGGNYTDNFNKGHKVNNYPMTKDQEKGDHVEVVKEAIKNVLKEEKKEQKDKFNELVQNSRRILFRAKNIFPFDLFPDEIVITNNKVDVITKEFFWSGRVHSISIPDITDVFLDSGPFFASLKIVDVGFVENSIDIKYLKKSDAQTARRIIQGLVVVEKEKIDVSQIEDKNLVEKIEAVGDSKAQELS